MPTTNFKLLVDWDDDGNFTGSNDDITAYVLAPLVASRGRDFYTTTSGRIQPGRFSCVLKNDSQIFSYWNTNSPLEGKLEAGKVIQLQINDTPVWTGITKNFVPNIRHHELNTINLTASGRLWEILQLRASTVNYQNVSLATAMQHILTASGVASSDVSTQTSGTMLSDWHMNDQSVGDAILEIELREAGQLNEEADGGFQFYSRSHRSGSPSLSSTYTLQDSGTGFQATDIEYQRPLDDLYKEYHARVVSWTRGSSVALDAGTTYERENPDTYTLELEYEFDNASTNLAHAASGTITSSGGTTWTATNLVNKQIFELDLSAEDASNTYTINRVASPLTKEEGQLFAFTDEDSLGGTYDEVPEFTAASDAQAWLSTFPLHFEQSLPFFRITLPLSKYAGGDAEAAARNTNDAVTLDMSGADIGFTGTAFIERIEYRIDADRQLTMIVDALPYSSVASTVFVLGTDSLGSGVLG